MTLKAAPARIGIAPLWKRGGSVVVAIIITLLNIEDSQSGQDMPGCHTDDRLTRVPNPMVNSPV